MNSIGENKSVLENRKGKKKFFSKFFSWFKNIKNVKNKKNKEHDDLDYKLVYSLSPKKIPSIQQLKYTKKVLRPKEKIIINILTIIVVATLIFLGIKFYKKHLIISPESGGEYIEGLIGSPKNINPLYDSARDVDSDISRLVFSSLFKRDQNGQIIKDIVNDYSISDNGLEYTIKIRDDVKWHHGEKLNCDDIIFTIETIKNPEYGSPLRSGLANINISKIDDYSFKITLSEPYSAFLELLTFGILPQNLWSTVSSQNAFLNELNIKPIGSGPYKFKSLTKNKSGDLKEFVLVANNDYYDQIPYISKVIFKFYSNYNELISALNNNQVDGISYLPHSLKSDLISQNSINFNKLNLPQITSIFLSRKNNAILENKEIRRVLDISLDKNKIINEIFFGNAGIANGPILPSSLSYNNEIKKNEYNLEEAKNVLNQASWKTVELSVDEISLINDLSNLESQKIDIENKINEVKEETTDSIPNRDDSTALDNINLKLEEIKNINEIDVKKVIIERFGSNGENLSGQWRYKVSSDKDKKYDFLTINLTTVDLVDNIAVADFIKSSWEKIGIKTFLKIINPGQVQSEIIRQRNFEALLLSQVIGGDQDTYAFWHSSQAVENGLNISEYKNKEVDKLLEDARLSLKSEEKIEKYKKFQEVLSNDSPVIFLYFPTYTYVQNKKIKGFDFNSILSPADRFNNISHWYIKIKRKLKF